MLRETETRVAVGPGQMRRQDGVSASRPSRQTATGIDERTIAARDPPL
jgi:hypothetical protein